MIKLIELPTIVMDAVMYTSAITSTETTESAVRWILDDAKHRRNKEGKHGTIEFVFFNNASREHIEVRYSEDCLLGRIPDEISEYTVIDISAKHFGRSGTFNYVISIMDPESKEYSSLHNDDDDLED